MNRLLRLHSTLVVITFTMLILALISACGLLFDNRLLLGIPIWTKPFKFAISSAIYTATTAWLISLMDPAKKSPPTEQGHD
jgi:hypothetical protein